MEEVFKKSDTEKAWKKLSSALEQGISLAAPGVKLLDEWKNVDEPVGRENLQPIMLQETGGIGLIAEGGMETYPSSVGPEEMFFTVSEFNGRFNTSLFAEYIDRGQENQFIRQVLMQSQGKVAALGAEIDDKLFGSSSGVVALTDTDIAITAAGAALATPLTLTAAYGRTGVTNARFITEKIKVGERVAIIDGDTLVGVIKVTARDLDAGTITGTAESAIAATTTNSLKIVKANQMPDPDLGRTVTQTDYNRGLVGFADILFSSGLHSLTHERHVPSHVSTTAGRFTGAKLRRANYEIDSQVGGKVTDVWMDPFVKFDMIENERAALRVDDPMSMSIDGNVKSQGRRIVDYRRVPPGDVYCFDKSGARRWDVYKSKNPTDYAGGKEYINQAAKVHRITRILGIRVPVRGKFAAFTNQTRSSV